MANWSDNIDFESGEGYSAGDLNGQNGWSGDVAWDVAGNQVYHGSQSIQAATSIGVTIAKSLAATIDGGTVYWAFRYATEMTSASSIALEWRLRGAAAAFRGRATVLGAVGSDVLTWEGTADGATTVGNVSPNTWYVVEINWTSTTTATCRFHNGTSWTSTVSKTFSAADIASMLLISPDNEANTIYFDDITTTNPITPPAPAAISIEDFMLMRA